MHTESHKQPKLRQHDSEAPSRGKITERSRSVPLSTIRVRSIATNNGPCNIKTYIFESNESQSPISGNNESAYKKCSDNGCRHQSTHCQRQEIAFFYALHFSRLQRSADNLVLCGHIYRSWQCFGKGGNNTYRTITIIIIPTVYLTKWTLDLTRVL